MTLRFLTAGESHGPELNIILEGIPANMSLLKEDVDVDLRRRQAGYGRGARMKIEKDQAFFTAGVRHGRTFGGAPVGMKIINKDHEKWLYAMSPAPVDETIPEIKEQLDARFISKVRPGHADLAGAVKYNATDVRDILERSSARETTSRVAVGAVCKKFLSHFGIEIFSHVLNIGEISLSAEAESLRKSLTYAEFKAKVEESELRICDVADTETQMKEYINQIRKKGDTVGGTVEVFALGVPVGLGSHVQWDRRLDGLIAQALMSVHTVKSVEIGMGKGVGEHLGSVVQDQIFLDTAKVNKEFRYSRKSNNLGGIEGGMSNGEPIVCKVGVKPIPTLVSTLDSIDLETQNDSKSHFERSDVCVVPAAGVVLEAMLAFTITKAFLEKFGADSMEEIMRNFQAYQDYCLQR